ncbi:F420-dependent oxidoreductase [Streptomyces griseoflavus]|uniref:LLM class flavin-dependent oxidoreductase n=1 Tax=Streptomyces rimosus TaxID=1927 RepID=UPI0004CA6BB7|nr:LLM class flavin-dependent oxidoreductase [Streptomyces rimosus]KOG64521.1 F420-dependent oxidoreductase [Streptomyces griseoflavus]
MANGPTPADLSVGVLLPTREQAIKKDFAAAPLLEFARQAELLGFDSVWAGDSLTARPRLDPLVLLSAVGAVTSRVTLGTAALTAALRPPLIGANMIACLDQVCSSRLVLGLGAGFPIPESEAEFAAVGVPFQGRAGRLDETAALWRGAWRSTRNGAPTGFTGRRWQAEGLDRLPAPHRPEGPPLWLAGSDTPRVLERVARLYDGWLPFLPTAAAYGRAWQRIRELSQAAGRPADAVVPALYATITVDDDRDRARRELDDYLRHYYGRSLEQMSALQAYAWGSAEECAEWLAGYVRAGARHLVLRIGSLRPEARLKEIAGTVLPVVRG